MLYFWLTEHFNRNQILSFQQNHDTIVIVIVLMKVIINERWALTST